MLRVNGNQMERVDRFWYLGVYLMQDLSWSCHTLVKKTLQFLYQCICIEDFKLPSQVLRTFLTCHSKQLDRKNHSLVLEQHQAGQVALKTVVRSAECTIHTELLNGSPWTKAKKIVKDLRFLNNRLFGQGRTSTPWRSTLREWKQASQPSTKKKEKRHKRIEVGLFWTQYLYLSQILHLLALSSVVSSWTSCEHTV